jgi:hypothetical protein
MLRDRLLGAKKQILSLECDDSSSLSEAIGVA